jgi:hypothetical protein
VVTSRLLLREVWSPAHAEQGHYLTRLGNSLAKGNTEADSWEGH